MYATDRGIEELEQRRGDETVSIAWIAERMRVFVDLHPRHEPSVDALAVFLARDDWEAAD